MTLFESDIIRKVRLREAAWAILSWNQPSFDSLGQNEKRLPFPPSEDSQAAMELWAPPTYSLHIPALPAALARWVPELQLPVGLAAFASGPQTAYPRRPRSAFPVWECSHPPGPGCSDVNSLGSSLGSFLETGLECTYLKTPEH